MKKTVLIQIVATVFLAVSVDGDDAAVTKHQIDKKATVAKSIVFTDADQNTFFQKELDLGGFLPGTEIACELAVTNNSERTLSFTRLMKGCKCLSIEPQSASLLPGESLDLRLVIRTPLRSKTEVQRASFSAYDGNTLRFGIKTRYSGKGVVGFPATAVSLKLPKGVQSEKLSISFFADTLSPEQLVALEASPAISKIDFKIDFENKVILADIPESIVQNGRVSGELIIRNIETGAVDQVVIDFESTSSIEIYPSSLRLFSRAASDGTKEFVGSLVVHDKVASVGKSPHATFSIDGHKLSSDRRATNKGVAVFKLKIPSDVLDKSDLQTKKTSVLCEVVGSQSRIARLIPIVTTINDPIQNETAGDK